MTSAAHTRGREADLDTLIAKASTGDISAVETALGRFKGADAVGAARQAADAARREERWDNLAYLADFLHDVSAHGGDDSENDADADDADDADEWNVLGASKTRPTAVNVIPSARAARRVLVDCVEGVTGKTPKELDTSTVSDETWDKVKDCTHMSILSDCVAAVTGKPLDEITPDEVPAEDRAAIGDCADASILSYVTLLEGAAAKLKKEGGADTATMADIPSLSSFVQTRVPAHAEVATFTIVDEDAAAGDYRSAEDPSPYVSIADPEEDIGLMRGADDHVVDAATIRVLYSYPFDTHGPTPEEQEAEGWIFEEKAPNGAFFTRADLARAVAARYCAIYAEEEESTKVEPGYIPGMLNRNRTNGRYGIWGHDIGDLLLHTVEHDPVTGVYTLGIDS